MTQAFPFVLNAVAGTGATLEAVAVMALAAACHSAGKAGEIDWLAPGRALDIPFDGDPDSLRAALRERVQDEWRLDANIVPTRNRRKKLLVADMDSTIIEIGRAHV